MSLIAQSIRVASRRMVRRPMFALLVIALLGLAIGAGTAVFSVLDAVVLQATPFPEAGRLYALQCRVSTSATPLFCPVAAAVALRARSATVDEVAYYGFGPSRLDLRGSDPQLLITRKVSSSFFSTLGRMPQLGRWFLSSDNSAAMNNLVVLSDSAWDKLFERRKDILGTTIQLDKHPYIICGVMPPGFTFPTSEVQAWVLDPITVARMEQGDRLDVTIILRLTPSADAQGLQAELGMVASRLVDAKGRPSRVSFEAVPLRDLVLGPSSRIIWLLFLGTQGLLLIVMGNMVNLLAVRSAATYGDQVLRIALGASRRRLLVEHLIEQLVLAPAVAATGVGIAAGALEILSKMGGLHISRSELATMDIRTCLFAASLSVLVLVAAGLLSFLPVALTVHLSGVGRTDDVSRQLGWLPVRTLQRASLVAQLCVAVVLVVTGSSALRLLGFVRNPPLGYDAHELIAIALDPVESGSDSPVASPALFRSLLEDVRKIPGVDGTALCSFAPLRGVSLLPSLPVKDDRDQWMTTPPVKAQRISAEYFHVMRIPLLAGRVLTADDSEGATCAVVVNKTFASLLGGPDAAVGRIVSANGMLDATAERCVIRGIVGDARDARVQEEPGPHAYFSYVQRPDRNCTLLIRTHRPASEVVPFVRALVSGRAPGQRVGFVSEIWKVVGGSTQRERLVSYQILFFGMCGFAVALMGIFAMVDYFLGQKQLEIGVRLALGAQRSSIVWLVTREFVITVGLGLVAGSLLSYSASRYLTELVGGVLPRAGSGVPWIALAVGVSAFGILVARVAMLPTADVKWLLRAE